MAQPDPIPCGICLTGYDIGVPSPGIAYVHPDCPEHGNPIDDIANGSEETR